MSRYVAGKCKCKGLANLPRVGPELNNSVITRKT